jgi:hypothetical protein
MIGEELRLGSSIIVHASSESYSLSVKWSIPLGRDGNMSLV